MCGICGFITKKQGVDLKAMVRVMEHRGPDDEGVFLRSRQPSDDFILGLGHRRLSILDLSQAGHQPMASNDRQCWLSFNGEIYNFLELRGELQKLGYQFKTQTDTEVILAAYQQWGEKSWLKFDGMFAFALWDENKQALYLVRDRPGIKPLYYGMFGKDLVFASEIKAILKSGLVKAQPNLAVLPQYLAFLWVPGPNTMFKDIYKLPAGHCLKWQAGKIEIKEYWDIDVAHSWLPPKVAEFGNLTHPPSMLPNSATLGGPPNDTVGLMKKYLFEAVKSQLISDVPLAAFLSGGIDSSAIVALMTRVSVQPVKTFTINIKDKEQKIEGTNNDLLYARLLKKYLGNKIDYQEISIKPDIVQLLPQLIRFLEEPLADPAAILAYLICQAAKNNGYTVLLSGMGADEIFAGYNRHRLSLWLAQFDKYHLNGLLKLGKLVAQGLTIRPQSYLGSQIRYLKRIAKSLDLKPIERYLGLSAWLSPKEIGQLLNSKLGLEQIYYQHQQFYTAGLGKLHNVNRRDVLWSMLYTDAKTFLTDHNLNYTDKMSMAASCEVRVPYLANEIVDFAFSLPDNLKIKYGQTKYILRRAIKDLVPQEIVNRGKTGFGVPLRAWFNDLMPLASQLLSKKQLVERGLFDPEVVFNLIRQHRAGKQDYAYPLWALLTLELWWQEFID